MPARLGSTGGLSQPRRDTVDPKKRSHILSTPCGEALFLKIYRNYIFKSSFFKIKLVISIKKRDF